MAVPYTRMASRCQCGSLSAVSAGQRPEPRRLPRTVVPTAREYQGQIRSRPEAYMEAPDGTSEDFEHRKMLAGFGEAAGKGPHTGPRRQPTSWAGAGL
jgi:hypothetical protein